jgi:hypothetical protein
MIFEALAFGVTVGAFSALVGVGLVAFDEWHVARKRSNRRRELVHEMPATEGGEHE